MASNWIIHIFRVLFFVIRTTFTKENKKQEKFSKKINKYRILSTMQSQFYIKQKFQYFYFILY